MEKDFDNLQGSRLSVVAFDYRAWGGDEGAMRSAKQYLSARKDVFYFVFLALSPLKRKGDRKTALEDRRTSRLQRLVFHFYNECKLIILDEDLIALTQVFLPCGSALLEDSPNWPEKIRRKMSEPVRDMLMSLEHIRGTLDPGGNMRCFGHALQSETRAIIFIGIVGSRLQDSLLLRKALAEGYSECEKWLITVGVSSSGPTHFTSGKVNWTDLDAVQAAQNGAFVELALNLGVAYSLSRSLGRTFKIKKPSVILGTRVQLKATKLPRDVEAASAIDCPAEKGPSKQSDIQGAKWARFVARLLEAEITRAFDSARIRRDERIAARARELASLVGEMNAIAARQRALARGSRATLTDGPPQEPPRPQAQIEEQQETQRAHKRRKNERRKAALRRQSKRAQESKRGGLEKCPLATIKEEAPTLSEQSDTTAKDTSETTAIRTKGSRTTAAPMTRKCAPGDHKPDDSNLEGPLAAATLCAKLWSGKLKYSEISVSGDTN